MILNKTKKTLWKQNVILQKDCRMYNKRLIEQREALQSALDGYRGVLGITLLSGVAIGLFVAGIINYFTGRW